MEYLIIYLVVGVICGLICSGISSSRDMDGSFWWGFWLGIIGIVIVAVRPNEQKYESSNYAAPKGTSNSFVYNNDIPYGGWKCKKCGQANLGYVSTCSCGAKRDEQNIKLDRNPPKAASISEADRIKHIKEYKELLDAGVITPEEFDKKKASLLWENNVEIVDNISTEKDNKASAVNAGEYDGINPQGKEAVYLLPTYRDDYGTCPKCGSTQPKDRHVCWKCGVPLMYSDE